MSDTDKLKRNEQLKALGKMQEMERQGLGRIEYDDSGDPTWVPLHGLGNQELMRRLINDDSLTLAEEPKEEPDQHRVANLPGRSAGFDPYSGSLDRPEGRPRKKDLRALSEWIKQKKKMEQERGGGS